MGIKYDNDFDAEGFVENFRAEDVPPAPLDSNARASTDTNTPRKKKSKSISDGKGNFSEEVEEYKAKFIDDLKFRFPEMDWPLIRIAPVFKNKIRMLERRCGAKRANLSTFINNVLEQHFADNEALIVELKKKYQEDD